VDRIINVFPAGEQDQIRAMLSESIEGIVAQRLLPRADGKGRVAVQEILVATAAVRSLIREGKTHQIPSAIQTGRASGMQSLEQAVTKLSTMGTISRDVAATLTVSRVGGTGNSDGPPRSKAEAARRGADLTRRYRYE
jgi:twitching motility protein PilT